MLDTDVPGSVWGAEQGGRHGAMQIFASTVPDWLGWDLRSVRLVTITPLLQPKRSNFPVFKINIGLALLPHTTIGPHISNHGPQSEGEVFLINLTDVLPLDRTSIFFTWPYIMPFLLNCVVE